MALIFHGYRKPGQGVPGVQASLSLNLRRYVVALCLRWLRGAERMTGLRRMMVMMIMAVVIMVGVMVMRSVRRLIGGWLIPGAGRVGGAHVALVDGWGLGAVVVPRGRRGGRLQEGGRRRGGGDGQLAGPGQGRRGARRRPRGVLLSEVHHRLHLLEARGHGRERANDGRIVRIVRVIPEIVAVPV